MATFYIYSYDSLIGIKVWVSFTILISEPYSLTLGRLGLWCFHVRQDNMPIKAILIDV
jgi:hypothetical protein